MSCCARSASVSFPANLLHLDIDRMLKHVPWQTIFRRMQVQAEAWSTRVKIRTILTLWLVPSSMSTSPLSCRSATTNCSTWDDLLTSRNSYERTLANGHSGVIHVWQRFALWTTSYQPDFLKAKTQPSGTYQALSIWRFGIDTAGRRYLYSCTLKEPDPATEWCISLMPNARCYHEFLLLWRSALLHYYYSLACQVSISTFAINDYSPQFLCSAPKQMPTTGICSITLAEMAHGFLALPQEMKVYLLTVSLIKLIWFHDTQKDIPRRMLEIGIWLFWNVWEMPKST